MPNKISSEQDLFNKVAAGVLIAMIIMLIGGLWRVFLDVQDLKYNKKDILKEQNSLSIKYDNLVIEFESHTEDYEYISKQANFNNDAISDINDDIRYLRKEHTNSK